MIAMSALASASISGSTRSRSGAPRQNAWLIVTLPCMPSAAVRSRISSIEKAPISPGSCRWMSTGLPCFCASANTASRWPLGSRSMAQGSRPPTTSAPIASAWSISSTRAGTHQHAGLREGDDLEVDRRRDSARASPSRLRCPQRPTSVSTSTWLRIWVVPCATDSTIWRADCRAGSMPSVFFSARSLSILSISRGPAWCLVPAHAPQRLVEMGVRLDQARRARSRRRRRSRLGAGRSRRRSRRCARRRCGSTCAARPSGGHCVISEVVRHRSFRISAVSD